MNIVFFDTVIGSIDLVMEFPDGTLAATITAAAPAGSSWVEDTTLTANAEEYYILNPGSTKVLTYRPVISDQNTLYLEADGVDTIDLALPTGTVVSFDGTYWTSVANEHFQMRSTILGTYEIAFEPPFPYSSFTLEVQCDAA